MTTPAAAKLYEAQHVFEHEGRQLVIYNPNHRPVERLPVIMGFNNGGSPGWMTAVAIAEDGHVLGQHICSSECYMPADLGLIEGTRKDRHESSYRKHYPDGYRMRWLSGDLWKEDLKLQEALRLNKILAETETQKEKEPENI